MSVYAPFNTSYGQTSPYLTVAEYKNAPTALDLTQLVQGGDDLTQEQVLGETIGRASSWIDRYCCGAYGSLCATVDTENAQIWGDNTGRIKVHPEFWPILEVRSFAYGPTPGHAASVGLSTSNTWIEPTRFVVAPAGGSLGGFGSPAGVGRAPYYCTWEYVNGWANTTLSASVSTGDTSITPTSVIGLYPGTSFSVYDPSFDETCTVASTYTPGDVDVPLVRALLYPHAPGTAMSNLPAAVKQAAISLTSALIKLRGDNALVLNSMAEPTQFAKDDGSSSDVGSAKELLGPFRSINGAAG